jgi:hypothetical protein
MARVSTLATTKLAGLLRGETGLQSQIDEIAALSAVQPPVAGCILGQNVAPEVAEKTAGVRYPAVYLYCERISNTQAEKFRTFSGKARLVVETRFTHDRLEELESQLQVIVESVVRVLELARGDWGDGVFYSGAYDVQFGPVKHGGKHFIQTAKVTFDVDVSRD